MVDAARGGRNAAALAILALSALLVTPFLFQRNIAGHREAYTRTLDPAREASSEALLSLARQIAAIRGYLLTRDSSLLDEYREARSAQDVALAELAAVPHIDSAIRVQANEFAAATRAWNVSNDLIARGAVPLAQGTGRLEGQQEKYLAALLAGQELEQSIVSGVQDVRERVTRRERYWAMATIGLTVLAAAGALMVVLMMRATHRQSELARTDPLTGLYNRLGFDELASRELSRARRTSTATTLINFDLDGFKQVNDGRGHAAGDHLLRSVAKAIREAIRDIDVAGRLGGDEFAILLSDNRAQPPELAVTRVHTAIMTALAADRWPVTLSVGAVTASVQRGDVGVDEMIRISDKLMYSVKNGGKNAMQHTLLEGETAP